MRSAALARVHARLADEAPRSASLATLVVTALAVAYIVAKIDLGKTLDILGSASVPWLAALARR